MTDLDQAFATLDEEEVSHAGSLNPDAEHWRVLLPVPPDAPPLRQNLIDRFAPAGFAFTDGWRYDDAEGHLLGCAVRYDPSEPAGSQKKQVKPLTFCEGPGGRREWRCKAFPEPRPLYGLKRLAARPDAPVLLVEGEKTADAAATAARRTVGAPAPRSPRRCR